MRDAWKVAVADLVTSEKAPCMTVAMLIERFKEVESLSAGCESCKTMVGLRMEELVKSWLSVGSTI